jgi:hypothetical protein
LYFNKKIWFKYKVKKFIIDNIIRD